MSRDFVIRLNIPNSYNTKYIEPYRKVFLEILKIFPGVESTTEKYLL